MNTSKEYIEMCSKATEIQESKGFQTFNNDDFLSVTLTKNNKGFEKNKNNQILNNFSYIKSIHFYGRVTKNCTGAQFRDLFEDIMYLPRQDQLQEMILEEIYGGNCFNLHLIFGIKIVEEEKIYKTSYSSEQLWLAFVMKEKYSKIWNYKCKEWVSVK